MTYRSILAVTAALSLVPLSLEAIDEKQLLAEVEPSELERHSREIVRHAREGRKRSRMKRLRPAVATSTGSSGCSNNRGEASPPTP